LSRQDRLGLQAALEAVADAGLDGRQLSSAALLVGTGAGGALRTEGYQMRLSRFGERGAPASWLLSHQPASTADLIAARLGCRGVRGSIMTACSSSATTIGLALDLIRLGRAKRVLAGGVESICRLTFGGFSSLRAMDPEPCRPFHRQRRGLTLGDGAAMLVLEDAGEARRRGRQPYAELAGYGVSADAHHMTAPAPDGRGAAAAMQAALADAGMAPEAVQYINAHGTATSHNDPMEVRAIRQVFGRNAGRIPVSSTKAMTGHTLGAAGAIEAAICVLALQQGLVPATLRLDDPDPACDLDHVPRRSRRQTLEVALSNSFAFGGNNTTLVFRRT
jgi:3-oxoacyl-[acyl-carrier-protein] synthase II